MEAIFLSPPGTEYGPCTLPCEHRDCAETRREAASLCGLCGQPIGYDRRFYKGITSEFVHLFCDLEQIERVRPNFTA